MLDAKQVDNGKMLACLRHDAVVGRHDKQHEIDAARTGKHGVHEALMPGNVDEPDDLPAGRRQVGESEIDRHAARFFFLQAVGIDAGQRAHQCCLAVVDMPAYADDQRETPAAALPLRSASAISSALDRRARRHHVPAGQSAAARLARSSRAPASTRDRTPVPRKRRRRACLAVRIPAQSGAAPPADRFSRIAGTERIVVEHADPRHRRCDALVGAQSPSAAPAMSGSITSPSSSIQLSMSVPAHSLFRRRPVEPAART